MKINPFLFIAILSFSLFSCSNDGLNGDVRISDTAYLFATTNSGEIRRFNINNGKKFIFKTSSSNATGIVYRENGDEVTIVSKSSNQLQTYTNMERFAEQQNVSIQPSLFGSSNLQNPVDLAQKDDFYVVSDNTDADGNPATIDSKFYIYQRNGDTYILRNILNTNLKVGSIIFIDNDLYVASQNTDKIAKFPNFVTSYVNNPWGFPTKTVSIDGVTAISALEFKDGIMFIGDRGTVESDSDGAIQVVRKFLDKFNSVENLGKIAFGDQKRLAGNNTLLGNPVDIEYNPDYNAVFVAESLNGGGRIIAFNNADAIEGNFAPDLKYSVPGVTSIFFYTK
ncbi:hypothetical protein [Gramella sp. AN32]|uniref:Phytase-like domain-containing protein n=1 Tax=Christiangramia antarctica TaxID=2058158 RepID=A0ABW5X6G8_9FLAO|nr:hypothetical protein [Gramella sp. AN32]MCM4156281.1 hypothetical protein [Gramella sp. AN32]